MTSIQLHNWWKVNEKIMIVGTPTTMTQLDYAFRFSASTTLQLLQNPLVVTEVVISAPVGITGTVTVAWWGTIDWQPNITLIWSRQVTLRRLWLEWQVSRSASDTPPFDPIVRVTTTTHTAVANTQILTENITANTVITLPLADTRRKIRIRVFNPSSFNTIVNAQVGNLIYDSSVGDNQIIMNLNGTTLDLESDGLGNIFIS